MKSRKSASSTGQTFVVQFVWIPTLEKDRPSTDPRPPVTEEEAAATKKK
jgi:hypothetical protein